MVDRFAGRFGGFFTLQVGNGRRSRDERQETRSPFDFKLSALNSQLSTLDSQLSTLQLQLSQPFQLLF